MPVPTEHLAFWNAARALHPTLDEAHFYESFAFGDDAAMADELGALVLSGRKRATAALLWAFEAEAKSPPQAGSLSIMTSATGEPLALIETVSVQQLPFAEVSAEFAHTEGEGEATLDSWRRDHWAFFGRECQRLARTPSEQMPVICEVFRVLYPA